MVRNCGADGGLAALSVVVADATESVEAVCFVGRRADESRPLAWGLRPSATETVPAANAVRSTAAVRRRGVMLMVRIERNRPFDSQRVTAPTAARSASGEFTPE